MWNITSILGIVKSNWYIYVEWIVDLFFDLFMVSNDLIRLFSSSTVI